MDKFQIIFKVVSALPTILGEVQEITEDRFISLHEVFDGIEETIKAFGLDPNQIGIEITKDGDVKFVIRGILKKKEGQ